MKNTLSFVCALLFTLTGTMANAACPDYTAPACTAGEGVAMGKDQAKCPMPMCKKITEKCPTYSALTCEGGKKLALISDPKNAKCQMPVCQ